VTDETQFGVQCLADIEDRLFPILDLDVWERCLYYHLLRHTRGPAHRPGSGWSSRRLVPHAGVLGKPPPSARSSRSGAGEHGFGGGTHAEGARGWGQPFSGTIRTSE